MIFAHSAIKRSLLGAVALSAVALSAGDAMAGGFSSRQQSATGLGFAYAGAGTSAFGIGSMFWNPANITNFEGRRSEWNITLALPDTSVKSESLNFIPAGNANLFGPGFNFSRGDSGNINQGAVVPASYNSFQVNNWLWLGLQTGSPFGSTTKADAGFAAAVYGQSSKIRATAITPTVGIKVNEWLSFGFGVTGQQLNVSLKGGDGQFAAFGGGAAALTSRSDLSGDAYGFGYTAGVTVKPLAGTEISLGYRSSIKHKLEGQLSLTAPAALGGVAERLVSVNVNLPEIATLGIKQEINDRWTVTGTAQWTNWSRINIAPVVNRTSGAPITGIGFRYRDEWFLAAGAQYKWSEAVSLRAGVAYEISPITDETRGVRVLDANRLWLSAGLGYKYSNQLEFEVGYSHVFIEKGRVDIFGPGSVQNPAGNPSFNGAVTYSGASRGHIDLISVAAKYRWDAPAAAPVRPVVTKF
jgi:long-chain fatty acid transport protein